MSERATKNSKKFFVVMKDENTTRISYRHATIESAREEAVRLADCENGMFFVCAAIEAVIPNQVTVKTHTVEKIWGQK